MNPVAAWGALMMLAFTVGIVWQAVATDQPWFGALAALPLCIGAAFAFLAFDPAQ